MNNRASSLCAHAFSEIDVWLIIIITAYWVFLISDISARIILAIIVGLTSGLVYRFIIKKEEKTIKLTRILIVSREKLLIASFITLLFTFLTSSINDIYLENWLAIPATNWIRFIVVNAFCTFIPGFILIKLVDRENKLPTRVNIILSILLSIFFTSLFWYTIKMAALDGDLVNILFIIANFTLILIYLQHTKKKAKPDKTDSLRMLNFDGAMTLGILVILSVILVYIQQFIYTPFIRGDNWDYLSVSNYIDKGAALLEPVGKFYSVNPLSIYALFILALFRLSGFPPVNSMMITSLIIASLIPIAFYTMSLQYVKDKKLSMLSALIYVTMSGFGWVPFIIQKIGISVQHYSPQNLLSILDGIALKVLNDISQPQGAVPEGFKTYVLATLTIIMLLYLLESKLPSKARVFLIVAMTAFAFQVHIEEVLTLSCTFLPAYVLLSRKNTCEIRKDIAAMALGVLATFIIGLSCPTYWIGPLLVNYVLIALVFGLLFGYTFIKKYMRIRLPSCKLSFLKPTVLCLVCYFYLLSIIVLVFYGYENMYYGSLVVYEGFTFPWYYYPLSFGIVGVLVLVGLSMDFQKYRIITFFLIATVFLLAFGRIVSYINVNFFFTGTKEWRIIYRIVPIPASLFAGWAFYRLMHFFENTRVRLQFRSKLGNAHNGFQLNLRYVSPLLLILIIILGIPSTILASEYWMATDGTPYGRAQLTSYDDLEFANFVYQNVPITLRVATLSDRSNAIIRLAGGTTMIPSIYPNLLITRPETAALLSSDIGYVCIDKETDTELINCELVKYLPLAFNNSRFLVYKLLYLEPPSKSNVGYISPLYYTNRTLLSYLIVTSLNSSYQLVNDDIYGKSVMLMPSDFPVRAREVYRVETPMLLDWVENGGELVVLGGEGALYKSFGFEIGDYKNANEIRIGTEAYALEVPIVKTLKCDNDVTILSYYSLNGVNISPFVVQKRIGQGSIFYIYVDPIYDLTSTQQGGWFVATRLALMIRDSLEKAGLHLSSRSINLARFPLEKRWIGRYVAYGENDFVAKGDTTTNSTLSGLYSLQQPLFADTVFINSNHTERVLKKVTINAINVIGEAELEVRSNTCSSLSQKINSIPCYIPLQFENCTIKIRPVNSSKLDIQLAEGRFSVENGVIIVKSKFAQLVIEKPFIVINGSTSFTRISLPSTDAAWTNNAQLVGKLTFHIDYGDNDYFFCDQFKGTYITSTPRNLIEDAIPWKDIITSIPHMMVVSISMSLTIIAFKKSVVKKYV